MLKVDLSRGACERGLARLREFKGRFKTMRHAYMPLGKRCNNCDKEAQRGDLVYVYRFPGAEDDPLHLCDECFAEDQADFAGTHDRPSVTTAICPKEGE